MEDDKTAGWLVIITFLGFAVATMFAIFELQEITADNLFTDTKLFNDK
ncbi:MAG TPA: hypothetical protein VHX44_18205 [Planctomycetota bacterium]|nr:hypothetical protein [Planctomycetota bacterium]